MSVSSVRHRPGPVVPERFGWSLSVLLALAVLYAAGCVAAIIAQVVQLVSRVQPRARLPITFPTSYELPTNGLHNSYGGAPFVTDGTVVSAGEVSTTLTDVPVLVRLAFAAVPIAWTLTALLVASFLAVAILRLRAGASFGRDGSGPVAAAAAALGFGSTVAQVLQGAANLGLRAFAWGAPDVQNRLLIRTDGLTFEFTPLFFSIVLLALALALVLRRGALLQRETDGLV